LVKAVAPTATDTRASSPTKTATTSPSWSCVTAGARVNDSIRAGKNTPMRNLPHHAFEHKQTWLGTSLIAQDFLTWTKLICPTGELATAELKRLRHRLLHVAATVVRHERRSHLKLDRDWPWSDALVTAFAKLRAIPGLC
jgi:hypothetical protein